MKRLAITFLLVFSAVLSAVEGKITLSQNGAVKAEAEGVKRGMSAIVLYNYDGGSIITNRCEVTATESSTAVLKCAPFAAYDQNSVPSLTIAPRVGDRVIFTPLFSSAIVVAPSINRLVRVQERHKNFRFIHPDLLANMLATNGENAPRREDFQNFCDRYLVGTVIFALKEGDYITDCQTGALLSVQLDAIGAEGESYPFYHRLDPFDKGFSDFDRYYKSLITRN